MKNQIIKSNALRALGQATLIAVAIVSTNARAQTTPLDEIDGLINASTTADAAVATAAEQTNSGDISGAATTLERMLIIDPDSVLVRVRYIAALCQLDDQQAAKFETAKLAKLSISDEAWSAVQAACGPVAKPGN
jgi:predicted Zn-dependent protease